MAATIAPVKIDIHIGLRDFLRDVKTIEKTIENLEKIRVKAAKDTQKQVTTAEKAGVKATTDATNAKVRLEAKAAKDIERAKTKEVREHEKAEKEKTRAVDRETRKQSAAYDKLATSIMKNIEKQARKEAQALEAAGRARQQFANRVSGRAVNGITRGIGSAVSLAGTALGIMGGFTIADSVSERARMHGLASQVAIQGTKTGGEKFQSTDVLNQASAEGIRTGRGTEETLKGLGKFSDLTGDLKTGMAMMKTISDYADASGASFEDMSIAAGELFASKTVTNAEELSGALGKFVEMGKTGAVELKDFAKNFAKITATAGIFGGTKIENALTLGAMAEVAKSHGGAKGPTVALTSIQSFGNDVMNHSDKLKSKLGTSIRDKNGEMRTVQDIMADIVVGSKGREENLKGIFGVQGKRALRGSIETFNQAGGAANPEAGRAAVLKELLDLEAKELTAKKAADLAQERRAEADRQFAIVTEKLKVALGETLLPEVIKLIPKITEMIPSIVKLTQSLIAIGEYIANNPLKGLGMLVGAFLLKELAIAFAVEKAKTVAGGLLGGGSNAIGAGLTLGGIVAGAAGAGVGAAGYGEYKTAGELESATNQENANISGEISANGKLALQLAAGGGDEVRRAATEKITQNNAHLNQLGGLDTSFNNRLQANLSSSSQFGANLVTDTGTGAIDNAKQLAAAKAYQDSMKAIITSNKMLADALTKAGGAFIESEATAPDGRSKSLAERGGTN